jgi:hypothetical protein
MVFMSIRWMSRQLLNGELEEEFYMTQTDGYVVKSQEQKVCKLQKFLFGLKQAPKQWHENFDMTLISAGFSVNEVDRCVYYAMLWVRDLYCACMSITY